MDSWSLWLALSLIEHKKVLGHWRWPLGWSVCVCVCVWETQWGLRRPSGQNSLLKFPVSSRLMKLFCQTNAGKEYGDRTTPLFFRVTCRTQSEYRTLLANIQRPGWGLVTLALFLGTWCHRIIAVTVLLQLSSDPAGPQTALFRGDMLSITERAERMAQKWLACLDESASPAASG